MTERLVQAASFASLTRPVESVVPTWDSVPVVQSMSWAWVTLCDWLTSCGRVITSCSPVTCRGRVSVVSWDRVTFRGAFKGWVTFCGRVTYCAWATAGCAAASKLLQARMPSAHVCSNVESPTVPHLLNQEPPTAQQLTFPVFGKVPHVQQKPSSIVFEGGNASSADAWAWVKYQTSHFSYFMCTRQPSPAVKASVPVSDWRAAVVVLAEPTIESVMGCQRLVQHTRKGTGSFSGMAGA